MIDFPEHETKIYPAANRCIYCDSVDRLSDEHIFPYGLGGRWVIPKGSCHECARVTSAYEGTVQRTMLGPLRLMLKMPSRRKRGRPNKLPLKVRVTPDDEWTFINVDQKDYPFLITLPILTLPDEIKGSKREGTRRAAARKYWIRAPLIPGGFDSHCRDLATRLGVVEIMPTATSDAEPFFRMLAKIAHAFTVAELGAAFTPFLRPLITGGSADEAVQYIGGIERTEGPAEALHQLWFVEYPRDAALITVRVRLLARFGTPTYVVAVGRRKSFPQTAKS